MKKKKALSIILAGIMALSSLPVMSVSAAEVNSSAVLAENDEPTSIGIKSIDVTMTENVFKNSLEELPFGTKAVFNFSNSTKKELVLDGSNCALVESKDYSALMGCRVAVYAVSVSATTSVFLSAIDYITDKVEISFMGMSESTELETLAVKSIKYPKTTVVPDTFAKDYVSYRKNADNTLTATSYLGSILDVNADINIVIPESIFDMTVTSIFEGAFSGYLFGNNSVTIPETVTEIPKYSVGYSFKNLEDISAGGGDGEGDIFDVPDGIEYDLYNKIKNAADSDTFLVNIFLYGEDCEAQRDSILDTYFNNEVDYEYDDEFCIVTLSASKAAIFEIAESETDLWIALAEPNSLSNEVAEMVELMSDDDEIDLVIKLYTEEYYEDYQELADRIVNTYFDGEEDYIFIEEEEDRAIYISGTKKQIEAIASDSEVYVCVDFPDRVMDFELYKELFAMEDTDVCDLQLEVSYFPEMEEEDFEINNGLENKLYKEKLNSFLNAHFEGCTSELINISTPFIYIKDATKAQIQEAVMAAEMELYKEDGVTYLFNSTDGLPIEPSKGFTIYGCKDSAAEKYAKENSIKFVEITDKVLTGDVNLDGVVSILDATEIQKHIAKLVELDDTQLAVADTNHDGNINVLDATEIQKYVAKLISSLD